MDIMPTGQFLLNDQFFFEVGAGNCNDHFVYRDILQTFAVLNLRLNVHVLEAFVHP